MVCPVMARKPRKRVRRRTELPGLSAGSQVMWNTTCSVQPPVSPGCGSHELLGKQCGSPRVPLLLRGQILHPLAHCAALGWGQHGEQPGGAGCTGHWDGQCCPSSLHPQPFAVLVEKPSK